ARHGPALGERPQLGGVAGVAPRDRHTVIQQNTRDGGHARAADPDHVDMAQRGGDGARGRGGLGQRRAFPAASRATCATTSAASREPPRSAAADIDARRSGSSTRGRTSERRWSAVRSRSSTSRAAPPATRSRALSACSPLPCGSGTNTAGSPTADTSATVMAPARDGARSAAAYARSLRSRYGTATSGTPPGPTRGAVSLFLGPTAWRTPAPARENSPATSDIAALSERAPWEPPTTRTVGASGSRPNSARARARRSARSSEDTVRLTGLPTTRASSPEPWTAARVATANRSPSLLASPARALASCTTIGTRPLVAAAARYIG